MSFRGFGHSRGAEVLAFPRCGEGVNPKAHSVRFEDPAAVSAARLADEGKQTGDYRLYIIAMRLFFTLISHPRLRSDASFPTAGEAKSLRYADIKNVFIM